MNHDNERKAFEEWIKNEDPFIGNDDNPHCIWAKKYMWEAWLASANREGYKLVPVQPSNDTIVAIERKVEEQLEASAIDADPFRLDGENIYKAMIGACDN